MSTHLDPTDLTAHTVAVTGAAGFIGRAVIRSLVGCGATVVAIDSDHRFDREPVDLDDGGTVRVVATETGWPYEGVVCEGVASAGGNGAIEPSWLTATKAADAVIHLGYAEPRAENRLEELRCELALNVLPTIELLDRLPGDRIFCFASSSLVYGQAFDRPAREDDLPQPDTPYVLAKLAVEHALGGWAGSGRQALVLRIATVYGPGETVPRAVPNFIRRVLGGQPPQVAVSGDRRDYVHVDDVARSATLLLAHALRSEERAPDAAGEVTVVNVGTGMSVSTGQLADLVVSLAGSDLVPEVASPVREARSAVVDPLKLEKLIGFQSSTSLADGLVSELDWFRERPHLWWPAEGTGDRR